MPILEHIRLAKPQSIYMDSYLEACRGFRALGIKDSFRDPETYHLWGGGLFEKLERESRGEGIAAGRVPASTFWLVDTSDNTFIGEGNIRHSLTPFLDRYGGHIGYGIREDMWSQGYGALMLSLLLREAWRLGISEALITCNEENKASARVMEKNGGVYINSVINHLDGRTIHTRRYLAKSFPHYQGPAIENTPVYRMLPGGPKTPVCEEWVGDVGAGASVLMLGLDINDYNMVIDLAREGRAVTCVELSPIALRLFREHLEGLYELEPRLRGSIRLRQGGINEAALTEGYGLVIAPGYGFQALTDDADIHHFLDAARKCLDPGGSFIVNTLCLPDRGVMYNTDDCLLWGRSGDAGQTARKFLRRDSINAAKQTYRATVTYKITAQDGRTASCIERRELKYYYKEQLTTLLRYHGFNAAEINGEGDVFIICT